jgi:hypothetical protein
LYACQRLNAGWECKYFKNLIKTNKNSFIFIFRIEINQDKMKGGREKGIARRPESVQSTEALKMAG